MKGFKMTAKGGVKSGHHFGEKQGFSGSSGKVQNVSGYTRRVVKKADGGQVKSPGNAAQLRTEPVTDFDQQYGGRGPLAPGYKKGGYVSVKGVEGPISDKEAALMRKHVAAPKPAGHGVNNGRSFNRKPLIGR